MALVKLHVQQHVSDEIVVDTFTARSWEDFVLIKLEGEMSFTDMQFIKAIKDYEEKHPDKTVMVIAGDRRIDFYGIKEVDEERSHASCSCGHTGSGTVQAAATAEEAEDDSDSEAVRQPTD